MARPGTRHGIVIKEAPAFEADAGQHVVVQRPFHDIAVLAIKSGLQHSMPEQEESDRGTRLSVRVLIWKVVIAGEPLILRRRTDPTRDVELRCNDILPEAFAGRQQIGRASCRERVSSVV